MLIPSFVLTLPEWKSHIQPCIELYGDDLPSRRTLEAELDLWEQKWTLEWEKKWERLQVQHNEATGEQLVVSSSEINRRDFLMTLPLHSMKLLVIYFPISSLLTTLAVMPVTSCEAEHCISCLRRLKTYLRGNMGQTRLTGFALLHIHDIPISINEVIEEFALMHPRRMKLADLLGD